LKPKPTLVLVLIVIAPLTIAGWLGARIVRHEQVMLEHRFRELMLGQLRGVEAGLAQALDRYRDNVLAEMQGVEVDPASLRRLTRGSPWVLQHYVLAPDGRFVFPPVANPAELTEAERASLERTRQVWDDGALLGTAAGESGDTPSASAAGGVQSTSLAARPAQPSPGAWHTWYWGNGLQWMLWYEDAVGRIRAAEINRARLLAELIAALPETDTLEPELTDGRIVLADSAGRPLYQWGTHDAGANAPAVASLVPAGALGAFRLGYHAPAPGAAFGSGILLNLIAGLAVLAVAIVGLATYLYREQSREAREAARRVSFVNQVSHELKTPLTNIRMYAELLEHDLAEQDEGSRRHLGVIVSESQRLSRLIGNVLTFGRGERGALVLHPRPGFLDRVVGEVLEHFKPALEARQIEVDFRPDAAEEAAFDADAVEQIVGNLVSNVEKYGAAGRHLAVTTHQGTGDRVEITVADRGPGLPPRERQRIFEPFYRVNGTLTEGVSGTGIGLTISRELARLHGGDLELEPSQVGARFRVTLHCPRTGADRPTPAEVRT
jgi:signal transduction histidine kinase